MNKNASKVYAVLMDEESSLHTQDFLDYLEDELSHIEGFRESTGNSNYSNRSYPDEIIGSVTRYKTFGDTEVGFSVECVIRSGYYEGANLDFNILGYQGQEVEHNDPDFEFNCEFDDQSDMPVGMQKIQKEYADNWARTELEEVITLIEKVYKSISTPLIAVATFSNGETIYERVKS